MCRSSVLIRARRSDHPVDEAMAVAGFALVLGAVHGAFAALSSRNRTGYEIRYSERNHAIASSCNSELSSRAKADSGTNPETRSTRNHAAADQHRLGARIHEASEFEFDAPRRFRRSATGTIRPAAMMNVSTRARGFWSSHELMLCRLVSP